MWLCKFLTCSKSSQVTKEVQPLAEALADGQAVALGPIFLAHLFKCLHDIVLPKPMSCNPSGPIWLFQLWLQVYFPELGPTNSHSGRSPSDLSICLDHCYPDYLTLDPASVPTLETKEERQELWASILISRDLPYGLTLNKGNHYPCGCEVYYPAAVATKEASANSSHSQGEKRSLPSTQDVGEDQNSSGYDVEIPLADDIIIARPRKIPSNPLPPGISESHI
ncbi:hypothetical protein L3X38_032935 [Prunus dulcis]|uniref:Aminotransferase-like plant mobile domain-containing protein n=1 Tax=Prunus dulcis TaxID=3755 RepID=A0AAD4VGP6_PRUDU|nr:hypothetical protein L3X38_032935 [Prunus dulcis]